MLMPRFARPSPVANPVPRLSEAGGALLATTEEPNRSAAACSGKGGVSMLRSFRRLLALSVAAFIGSLLPGDASADPQVFEYRIEHALYGNIGTLTNVVTQSGDTTAVETKLHVAVRIFGMVIYRQEAHRVEEWSGDRLMRYRSVTATNGNRLEVNGEASGDGFVIASPAGTMAARGRVHTANPWSAAILNSDYLVSPRTGELRKARVSASKLMALTVDGEPKDLREYEITGEGRQLIWLDEDNVPVAFRAEEQGTSVDFIATRYKSLGSVLRQALRSRGETMRAPPIAAPELAAQTSESR